MTKRTFRSALVVGAFVMGMLPTIGMAEITTHIGIRDRAENTIKGNIQADPSNGNYRAAQRTEVSVTGYYENVKSHVTFQENRNWSNGGQLRIYEAYTEFGDDWYWRVGRQEFKMDEGRILGNKQWLNGLTHDGLLLGYKGKGQYHIEILGVREQDKDWIVFHPTTEMAGVQLALPILYESNAAHSHGEGETISYTTGLFAKVAGDFNWRLETYAQQTVTRSEGGEELIQSGFLFSAQAGYKIAEGVEPVFNLDFTTAATNKNALEFSQPYANAHQYNGNMGVDLTSDGGGLIAASLKNSTNCGEGVFILALHYFMLADAKAAGVEKASLGYEVDLEYSVRLSDSLQLYIGESLFLDQGSRAPSGKNITLHDWTYVQLSLDL